MPYSTYEQVTRLDTGTQRHLLQHGDAVERVWAAWALGVTLGSQSTPDLRAGVEQSPDAGTRRQLLVVLAGLGERAVLRTFAADDPDAFVRATACQYLLRIAQPSESAPFLRARLHHDPSPIVRNAIMSDPYLAFPPFQVDDLTARLGDLDRDIRAAAIERLLVLVPTDQLFPGVLKDRLPHEDDAELRRALVTRCIAAGGAAAGAA